MGGDHGHHQPSIKIPDWRIYKVEDVPQLVKVQNALAEKGLKDPWLRNEVWRYNAQEFGTYGQRARAFFLRGSRVGVPAFLVTIAAEKLWEMSHPSDHGHDQDH